jgi:hypothetical protein
LRRLRLVLTYPGDEAGQFYPDIIGDLSAERDRFASDLDLVQAKASLRRRFNDEAQELAV